MPFRQDYTTSVISDCMHCKDVSVRDVDFALTENNIDIYLYGRSSYTRTEYIVFRNGGDYAVVEIHKVPGKDLFKAVSGHTVISLPESTVFFEDPGLDVLNTPALAEIQQRYPGNTVVVKGMFSHINFIDRLNPIPLRVIDNIPPAPSKLGVLVRKALDSGFIDHPLVIQSVEIDMAEKVSEVSTDAVMFPCKVSGLRADMPYFFLDDHPVVDCDVTLIGCNLSRRIFCSLYGHDVPFINVCPMDNIPDDGMNTIVKCCKVKSGHEIDGNVAKVPWGATVPEVVGAINDLFSE